MKKIGLFCVLASCLLLVTACGKNEKNTETQESAVESAAASSEEITYQTVGAESEDAFSQLVKNSTGLEVKGIAVKTSEAPDYPANMLTESAVVKSDETVMLYYTPEKGQEEAQFMVQLTFADDSVMELSSLPFAQFDEKSAIELLKDETSGVLYLKYMDKDGKEASTQEQEIAYKAQKDKEKADAEAAAAAAAAEAEAQANAAAAAEQAQQAPAAESYDQSAGQTAGGAASGSESNSTGSAGSGASGGAASGGTSGGNAGSAPAEQPAADQNTDSCLDEPAFN